MSQRFTLESEAPGILGLMHSFPKLGAPLNLLAQTILVEDHENVYIPRWIREYLAGSCSQKGQAEFSMNTHFAVALACSPATTLEEMHGLFIADPKWLKLEEVAIAAYSRPSTLRQEEYEGAVDIGCTFEELHLVVLLASMMRMLNAYVKSIGNPGLDSQEAYRPLGEMIVARGYMKL